MNVDRDTEFLQSVVQNEALDRFRAQSLEVGLAAMRRRRISRRVLTSCALAAIAGTIALCMMGQRTSSHPALVAGVNPGTPAKRQVPAVKERSIEPISDEELLALFPHETVALIGSPGNQRFLVYSPPQRRLAE